MNDLYYYKTIEECEKEIINKAIIFDIIHFSNTNLLECFIRIIRTIIIWSSIIIVPIAWKIKGSKISFRILVLFLLIYFIGKIVMNWVRYNYKNANDTAKINLVDRIIMKCEEYQKGEYEEWQKKQMVKRFANLANITIDWDNAK